MKRPPSAMVIHEGNQILIKVPPIRKIPGLSKHLRNVIPSIVSICHSANWHIGTFSTKSRQELNSSMKKHCIFLHETCSKGRKEIYKNVGILFRKKPLVLIALYSVYHFFTTDSIIMNNAKTVMDDLKNPDAAERARRYIGVFRTLFVYNGRKDWNNSEDKAKQNVEKDYSIKCDANKLRVTRGKEHEALRIHSSGTTA